MGRYIKEDSQGNVLPAKGKVEMLIDDGAKLIPKPTQWEEGLVCVVDNGPFDAAAYMFSPNEMEQFLSWRQTQTWLKYPHAKELAR